VKRSHRDLNIKAMRYIIPTLFSAATAALLTAVSPALAQPEIEITSDTNNFQNREIAANGVKVSVSYDGSESFEEDNLRYTLYYNDREQRTVTDTLYMYGSVSLQDLDSNGTPEVIVQTYSGGAHCCTTYQVYTWQDGEFVATQLGPADGNAGEFKDLNKDGRMEFLTFDQSFLYAFSSYAGSFPPSIILSYRDGEFYDVSREYRQHLRSTAWQMYLAIRDRDYEQNGVLAGYVAQKILLGEFEEGWQFMLVHYDRDSDWGFDIYNNNGDVIGRHRDFPSALRAFLIDLGYLNRNGQPNRALNLSDRIVANPQR
jgi:hypothetical protein